MVVAQLVLMKNNDSHFKDNIANDQLIYKIKRLDVFQTYYPRTSSKRFIKTKIPQDCWFQQTTHLITELWWMIPFDAKYMCKSVL